MAQLTGQREFAFQVKVLWPRLSDASFLVRCVPDVENITSADADQARCTIRPGFSFIRGTLELILRIGSRVENERISVELATKGIGSTSSVAAEITLKPADDRTILTWQADITSLGGLLKTIPQGLIRAAADRVIADALTQVDARLKAELS